VDGWFERWFLGGVVITAVGIWVGRKVGGNADWDEDEWDEGGELESGKMN